MADEKHPVEDLIHEARRLLDVVCEEKAAREIHSSQIDHERSTEDHAVYIDKWIPVCEKHWNERDDVMMLKGPEDEYHCLIALPVTFTRKIEQETTPGSSG